MNETNRQAVIASYLDEVAEQFYSGHAKEHAYRPALKALMSAFDDTLAVNDPKHSEHGAPDFIFLKKSNDKIIKGYAEAKDIEINLDKTEKTDQMTRYAGYANLLLTDYLEFRFFRNGEKYQTISLGHVANGKLHKTPENAMWLMRELEAFLELPPEQIRNGKRLAQIMGGKARRIRDNVKIYLTQDDERNAELIKIYEMMKKMLVHDLSEEKFADMYAQTLVYGLFVARYNDKTSDSFSRVEARDLVPKSNPFLRHFFDHIVGPDFDTRLGYIVDELCEIFLVSSVSDIVHKHLKIADDITDAKDPIIHFYEDFLQEYDPAERKKMGAYYTPIPVVQFIVRHVDTILKDEFGITRGLASDETIEFEVETGQDLRIDRRTKQNTKQKLVLPRIQVLDPAVGTATFLNETIKHIHKSFIGQEGRWASYVNNSLLKRLYGFELMMAPYTIAHLKLGMTLQETGVENLNDRLGVYLTNTLEEGIPQQSSLFNFGLAGVVSEESRLAAEIKSERPIMVVMGNPPYSGHSSNKTAYANSLVEKYKVEPGGQHKLNERNPKWLNDDYVKFIAFAEDMIANNSTGVVAMVTNNGYLDNPTFRGMRWHLTKTFSKIYVLDLHGSVKKQEQTNEGDKDENVFDIQQSVSIIIAVKTETSNKTAKSYYAELLGDRKTKFKKLYETIQWQELTLDEQTYIFKPVNHDLKKQYHKNISLNDLFVNKSVGVLSHRDSFAIADTKAELVTRILDIYRMEDDDLLDKYNLKEKGNFSLHTIRSHDAEFYIDKIQEINYRAFEKKYIIYSPDFVDRPRQLLSNMLQPNIALIIQAQTYSRPFKHAFVSDRLSDLNFISNLGGGTVCPLYIYKEDGTRTPNFNTTELAMFTRNLHSSPSPEEVLDYIYAALYSPNYRDIYQEFLKTDLPRVIAPASDAEFRRLAVIGRSLREIHLLKSHLLNNYTTTYPEAGSNRVELVNYDGEKVWINDTQYFGNVPQAAWELGVGGYLPAQKWLKDRKGQVLADYELDHYQKIIKALLETDKLTHQIDS